MTSRRVPLALALSAVLFVATGFAATKKIQHNDRSGDWTDLSLQSANLLNAGSIVSSGGNGDWLSNGGPSGPPLLLGNPGTADNWNGGTGNWSNGGTGAQARPEPAAM